MRKRFNGNFKCHTLHLFFLQRFDCFQIVRDDGLPQYICSTCLQLLNSAFTFKTLCEKSDQELRITEQNKIKEETNKYCATVLDDTNQNDLSDDDLKMNDNEIMISDEEEEEFESNIDDAVPMDNEMSMNDQSSITLSQKQQYYVRVPFPEQEYDGEVKHEENCTEIAEAPTVDGYVKNRILAFLIQLRLTDRLMI